MDTLTDILQLVRTIELMVQAETLSKQLLQNIGKLGMTTEVHAIQKHHHSKNKHFQSNPRSTSGRKPSSWDKGQKKCGNCDCSQPPKQCPAYGKECVKCKKKNHVSQLCLQEGLRLYSSSTYRQECHWSRYIRLLQKSDRRIFETSKTCCLFKQITFRCWHTICEHWKGIFKCSVWNWTV